MKERSQTFGAQGYRFGFQGQEGDNEVNGEGNSYAFKYRIHDPRLGRFFAADPLTSTYPFYSPYQFSGNSVIMTIELEGLEQANDVNAVQNHVDPNGNEMSLPGNTTDQEYYSTATGKTADYSISHQAGSLKSFVLNGTKYSAHYNSEGFTKYKDVGETWSADFEKYGFGGSFQSYLSLYNLDSRLSRGFYTNIQSDLFGTQWGAYVSEMLRLEHNERVLGKLSYFTAHFVPIEDLTETYILYSTMGIGSYAKFGTSNSFKIQMQLRKDLFSYSKQLTSQGYSPSTVVGAYDPATGFSTLARSQAALTIENSSPTLLRIATQNGGLGNRVGNTVIGRCAEAHAGNKIFLINSGANIRFTPALVPRTLTPKATCPNCLNMFRF